MELPNNEAILIQRGNKSAIRYDNDAKKVDSPTDEFILTESIQDVKTGHLKNMKQLSVMHQNSNVKSKKVLQPQNTITQRLLVNLKQSNKLPRTATIMSKTTAARNVPIKLNKKDELLDRG